MPKIEKGFSIEIVKKELIADMDYVTFSITKPNGSKSCLTIPIGIIEEKIYKDAKMVK